MASREINPMSITPEAARAEVEYLYKAGAEAQSKIDRNLRPEPFTIGDQTYISFGSSYERVKPVLPDKIVKPDTFTVFSLDGLIDYIKSDVDGVFKDAERRHIVRVTSPTKVEVISPTTGYWLERIVVVQCTAVVPDITFSRYMDIDDFQIMVQTSFEDSDNRAIVLKLAGSVRKEQSMQTADDGTSQKVTINTGVATASDVIVKNPVILTPFRTFREVRQPESPFILRFNEEAQAALFTGDGSAWKLEAVENIAAYLRVSLDGYNVKVIA